MNNIYIAATQFNLNYNAFEIYFSGCNFKCVDCHNPELWNFNLGEKAYKLLPEIKLKLQEENNLIKRIWLLGGEPLDQQEGFFQLISILKTYAINKEFWLWTGHDYKDIPDNIKNFFDYIKCGLYDVNMLAKDYYWQDENIKIQLASYNQYIIKKEK